MPIEYHPYVHAYGRLPDLFVAIRKASVPPKFSQDFVYSKLGLKSSSFRAMIPLLKRLGFLDQGSVPTESYKQYRGNEQQAQSYMAQSLRDAYSSLYEAHEYAHNLDKQELAEKLRTLTGASEKDQVIPAVVGTFMELCKLADFEAAVPKFGKTDDGAEKPPIEIPEGAQVIVKERVVQPLGISYTINLNLPPTTEIEVFNAIFKSLKEHILNEH